MVIDIGNGKYEVVDEIGMYCKYIPSLLDTMPADNTKPMVSDSFCSLVINSC